MLSPRCYDKDVAMMRRRDVNMGTAFLISVMLVVALVCLRAPCMYAYHCESLDQRSFDVLYDRALAGEDLSSFLL